eukprot:768166-Hanusia_phi.AAC.4
MSILLTCLPLHTSSVSIQSSSRTSRICGCVRLGSERILTDSISSFPSPVGFFSVVILSATEPPGSYSSMSDARVPQDHRRETSTFFSVLVQKIA